MQRKPLVILFFLLLVIFLLLINYVWGLTNFFSVNGLIILFVLISGPLMLFLTRAKLDKIKYFLFIGALPAILTGYFLIGNLFLLFTGPIILTLDLLLAVVILLIPLITLIFGFIKKDSNDEYLLFVLGLISWISVFVYFWLFLF